MMGGGITDLNRDEMRDVLIAKVHALLIRYKREPENRLQLKVELEDTIARVQRIPAGMFDGRAHLKRPLNEILKELEGESP